ncbi:MAG: WYL domain-containing protein [Actinomycetota bacterium]
MQRLERLFAVHERLRRAAPGAVSAARLAGEFGVTRRTIERDLAALRSAGVPLYAERGRHGGQVSIDRRGSAVVTLTADEVTALLVAVAAAGPDMPFADAATSAVARLLDGLPDSAAVAAEELRGRVRTVVARHPRSARRIRRTVETAVRRSLVVNLRYEGGDGEITDRAVEATGLYRGERHWYLIGWCRLREGGRLFRLDRIGAANLTRQAAPVRDVDDTLGWIPHEVEAP